MYIWILLATIMVALSFFNLSPRADKADAVAEIKATTLLNRFKIEHVALFKTFECESVLHIDSLQNAASGEGGWTSGTQNHSVEIDVPADENGEVPDLGYMKYADNLPIGYDLSISPIARTVKHAVLCLTKPLEDNQAEYANCFNTGYRYMLSYAPIPDRWLSKTQAEDENIKPLPMLTNFMSDEGFSGVLYGWTECDDDGCVLHGVSTVKREVQRQNGRVNNVKYKNISKDSLVWNDENFSNTCKTGIPCLFAYTRMSNNDKGSYCRRTYEAWKNEN